MIYFSAFLGFVAGFYAGLMILKSRLRGVSNDELQNNKSLWWKYGWIVWVTAFLGLFFGIYSWSWMNA